MKICLQGVSLAYRDKKILDNISLCFSPGLTYLVGKNGCGKSTLLKSLNGLLPYSGSILIDTQSVRSFQRKELASKVVYLRQAPAFPFRMKVSEYVLMGRYSYTDFWKFYSKNDRKIANQSLEQVGVRHLSLAYLNEISGGEFQKVAIARALCQQADAILLDEPTQSLDPKSKLQIHALLQQMGIQGKTIICVTHDIEMLDREDVHVVGINQGEIALKTTGKPGLPSLLLDSIY